MPRVLPIGQMAAHLAKCANWSNAPYITTVLSLWADKNTRDGLPTVQCCMLLSFYGGVCRVFKLFSGLLHNSVGGVGVINNPSVIIPVDNDLLSAVCIPLIFFLLTMPFISKYSN